jgi:hypothetical protein
MTRNRRGEEHHATFHVDRAPERARKVSPEYVQKLRNIGASESTLKYVRKQIVKRRLKTA